MADNIESEDMKDIKSPIAGIVTKIYVKEFSFVMQGDVLAEIKLSDTSFLIKQNENNIREYNKILSFSKKLKIMLFVLLLVGLFTVLIFPNLSFSLYHYSISDFIDTTGELAFSISGLIVFMLFMSRLKNGSKNEVVLKKQIAEENIITNKRKLYIENIVYEYDEFVDGENKEDNLNIEICIDDGNCKCCNLCALACPKVAIETEEDGETTPYINEDKCNKCMQCLSSCPYGLIYKENIEE